MSTIMNIACLCYLLLLYNLSSCKSELHPPPPALFLYSPGEPEYMDVLVKRVNDNLTLVCELKGAGDRVPRHYVWNFVAGNYSEVNGVSPLSADPASTPTVSKMSKSGLQLNDTGHYLCSAPPFSVSKYIVVQEKGPSHCARGAFWCGARCVLSWYVCDGSPDCANAEDESPDICAERPCSRPDKLNCTNGRCISESACCRPSDTLCRQPSCCDDHPRYSRMEGYLDEYPALFEDRHPPTDEYGFIQSTIYTVTACALIFMIAVVLLVSAICKMHMKRAALQSYARARRYAVRVTHPQPPPRYEAEEAPRMPVVGNVTVDSSTVDSMDTVASPTLDCPETGDDTQSFGLSRLSALFTARYRQVPTQPDVELRDVRPPSSSSPTSPVHHPSSGPRFCSEFYFTSPHADECARDLNYMATPVEYYRRRALRRNSLQRVIDQFNDAERPLTLQLGRFHLSFPRFGRSPPTDRRPDTPNVAEINIDDLDFVRVNSNDTYTLNGRTIRLLGGNFENYPQTVTTENRPPPYNEAMRYKLYGPPPEYLSRDTLNHNGHPVATTEDEEARSNVEMPPGYEELSATVTDQTSLQDGVNGNTVPVTSVNVNDTVTVNENNNVTSEDVNNDNNAEDVNNDNNETIDSIIENLPAIDDFNANEINGN